MRNFRDFGGCATLDGGRVRSGRLYRAAHLHGESAAASQLGELNVKLVLDLRRPGERTRAPSPDLGADIVLLFSDLGEEVAPPHEVMRAAQVEGRDAVIARVGAWHDTAPFSAPFLENGAAWFDALDRIDAPALVHCTAGKDRTGLLAALTLRTLGATPAAIVADYLATNGEGDPAPRVHAAAEALSREHGEHFDPEIVGIYMFVRGENLHRAFRAIEAADGSVEAYLSTRFGVDGARCDRLRAKLAER